MNQRGLCLASIRQLKTRAGKGVRFYRCIFMEVEEEEAAEDIIYTYIHITHTHTGIWCAHLTRHKGTTPPNLSPNLSPNHKGIGRGQTSHRDAE